MTDLITRAREQWCQLEYVRETVHGEQVTGYYSCPPDVVSTLLDVMRIIEWAESCPDCRVLQVYEHGVGPYKHGAGCKVAAARAAIAKALEEK